MGQKLFCTRFWVASLLLLVAMESRGVENNIETDLQKEVSHVAPENVGSATDLGVETFCSFEGKERPMRVLIAGAGSFQGYLFSPGEPDKRGAAGDGRHGQIALVVILALLLLSGIRYFRKKASARVCPRCHHRDFRHSPIRVLQEPTEGSNGKAVLEWTCGHCKFTDEETFKVSRKNGQLTQEGESWHVTYINDVPYDPYYYHDMAYHREQSADKG